MPPTNEPRDAIVLVDGLDGWDGPDASHPLALAARVEAAALAALAAQTRSPADGAELSLTFVTDEAIARLNHEWLDREGPTDVIAFGLGDSPLVGDVYISLDAARRQAEEFGLGADEELLRLAIHGVLHVAGYDHPEGEGRLASPMVLLQERVLARLLEDRPSG